MIRAIDAGTERGWVPCRTSTSECAVTSRRRRKKLVLLPPEGPPLRKIGAFVARHSLVFSAIDRTRNQTRLRPPRIRETAHLNTAG